MTPRPSTSDRPHGTSRNIESCSENVAADIRRQENLPDSFIAEPSVGSFCAQWVASLGDHVCAVVGAGARKEMIDGATPGYIAPVAYHDRIVDRPSIFDPSKTCHKMEPIGPPHHAIAFGVDCPEPEQATAVGLGDREKIELLDQGQVARRSFSSRLGHSLNSFVRGVGGQSRPGVTSAPSARAFYQAAHG